MRFLVTGGAGFIGSHLSEFLLERGDSVVALDNLATGADRNIAGLRGNPSFRLVLGSVMDELLTDELVEEADVVVHLAAAVGVKLIVERPMHSFRTNIRGTEIVLEAVHRHRKKVLVASTSEVYGKQSGRMHEMADSVIGPTSIARWAYATAKAADEILAFAYWREQRVPTLVVRLFNTVGPRQTGAYGMVVPRLVAQALTGADLTIYGDGTQTRCFCDVEDAVRAIAALIDEPRAVGDVFNIGSDEEVSIRELAERIVAATGSKSKIRYVPYEEVYGDQYEDMLRRVPDTAKIRDLVGWTPAHDLDAIVKRTVAYAQDVGPNRLLEG